MLKLRTLLCLMLIMASAGLAFADNWVKLDATNFPDAEFRNYLKANSKSSNTVYKTNFYNETTNEVNADAFTEVNINYQNGKKFNIQVNYQSIKNLTGIKLLRNVKTITLPAPTAKNRKTQLQSLDVSGMPYLETITNGSAYHVNTAGNKDITSVATGFTCPITSVVADNCPKLKTVILGAYTSLQSLSLENSPNIITLYVFKTGLKSLDISGLPNIANLGAVLSVIDQDYCDAVGATNNFTEMAASYTSFNTYECKELETLILGNQSFVHLNISYCDKLETIDVSGLPNLTRFFAVMHAPSGDKAPSYSTTNVACDHQHPSRSAGALKNVIFGNHPHLYTVHCTHGKISKFDLPAIAGTVRDLDLSYNELRNFDISLLKAATQIDVSYNRIHTLALPPNKSTTMMSLTDNCLTYQDQYGTTYSRIARINPYQYIRVGKAYRYKVFDDAERGQYVETADDTASQKYFYAVDGGHIGNPDNDETYLDGTPTGRKEDPCYFYFDNDYHDAVYFYRNPYTTSTHFVHGWFKVVLCRDEAIDFDPATTKFYLVGDFNDWKPTEHDMFVYDEESERYLLKYNDELDIVHGNFRVWDATTEHETSINIGGHVDDSKVYVGKDNHVFFTQGVQHKLGTEIDRHYTTTTTANEAKGYLQPLVEMVLRPGQTGNYIKIGDKLTGIGDITADADETECAPVYYDMQGRIVANPTAGIYICRRGNNVTKVVIR